MVVFFLLMMVPYDFGKGLEDRIKNEKFVFSARRRFGRCEMGELFYIMLIKTASIPTGYDRFRERLASIERHLFVVYYNIEHYGGGASDSIASLVIPST